MRIPGHQARAALRPLAISLFAALVAAFVASCGVPSPPPTPSIRLVMPLVGGTVGKTALAVAEISDASRVASVFMGTNGVAEVRASKTGEGEWSARVVFAADGADAVTVRGIDVDGKAFGPANVSVNVLIGPPVEMLQGGGFEDGHPNPYWTEHSDNFPQLIYNGAGPRTGSYWAWFGGAGYAVAESGFISQSLTIVPGVATLSFWMKMTATGAGSLEATLDGASVFSVDQDSAGSYAAYSQVQVDVSAFADGNQHLLKFAESDPDDLGSFDLNLDDVSLTVVE